MAKITAYIPEPTQTYDVSNQRQILESLVALEPKLEYKPLYFSVSKSTPHWQKVLQDLNGEIELMQQSGKFDEFIEGMKQQCYGLDKAA